MTRYVCPLRMEISAMPMVRGTGRPAPLHLLLQVELVELLDRAVVQALQLGHRLVRHVAAQLAHMQGNALGVARVLGQPIEMLYVHASAPRTVDAPALELQVNPPVSHREIAHPLGALVVAVATAMTAVGTHGGFFAA